MWANPVVPEAEIAESAKQCLWRCELNLIELRFQRPEQPLDPTVHPWASGVGALVPDTRETQNQPKQPRDERGAIIGANSFWFAEPPDSEKQVPK